LNLIRRIKFKLDLALFEYFNPELAKRKDRYIQLTEMMLYWQYPEYYTIIKRKDFEFN
jgi:hypothetical protein